ncbi:TIGR01459 family HAD-type hydrolase [Wenxinia saemankumensis]|uniref:HAD-superfamily class IIA hydrolase, TIGR01459 n=1 Tax=Wenxinia saemankumensis TaxID=1447782 RepID=A0A1M6BV13_9RHOB|nr:TIGR01459 family HAD-type hydrolase [Wenxinia saemankumensis]SHI52632.1 HAD-superfamily class IIA hydrolase, TIGR01459 [Wenxinia saemankumensis]
MTRIIDSIAEIAAEYDAAFVDLWGCMHNGLHAFPEAVAAMRGFRRGGGTVVLLTNAPRARGPVATQIAGLGIPEECYDTIATSGDAARAAMFQGVVGRKVWFVGEQTDMSFFEPLKIVHDPVAIERVPLEEAEGIVCCGPFDRFAAPDALRPQFLAARERGLKLLCANPDIVVDRGEAREWCAGALAQLYEEMGGEALYFGKPHPPVYDLARARLRDTGARVEDSRILCIGDGIRTDILGAQGEGLDSLFITGGLAAAETATAPGGQPDAGRLDAFLTGEQVTPTYSIGFLR